MPPRSWPPLPGARSRRDLTRPAGGVTVPEFPTPHHRPPGLVPPVRDDVEAFFAYNHRMVLFQQKVFDVMT